MPRTRPRERSRATIIRAFAEVARPVILGYFNRRSCIASSRITIEVLKKFGIKGKPLPVRFTLFAPSLKAAYVAGPGPPEHAVRLPSGPLIGGGGSGWDGHLIVRTRDYLIDPSFDQALDAIAESGHAIESGPFIAALRVDKDLPARFHGTFTVIMDDGTRMEADYETISDMSFLQAPAWELDHIQPAIEEITAALRKEVMSTAYG